MPRKFFENGFRIDVVWEAKIRGAEDVHLDTPG